MSPETSPTITRPSNPALFVAQAAEITNSADFARAAALYSDQARATLLIDGAGETYDGIEEISKAWDSLYAALQRRSVRVTKCLVTAGVDTIVNDWHAEPGMQGLEVWTFDEDGKVCDSRLEGFSDVRPSAHPWARLRVAVNAPRLGVTLLREQARTGLWPRSRASGAGSLRGTDVTTPPDLGHGPVGRGRPTPLRSARAFRRLPR